MLTFHCLPCSILEISQSTFHQIIKNCIFLKSAQNGLFKNVQDGISRPLGSREIPKIKVATVFLKLPYGHIADKGTSPLNELLFCVGQDAPLKLPYGHIAYKGTSPLHELLFCVGQDTPLKLSYGHIAYNGTSPHHGLFLCANSD